MRDFIVMTNLWGYITRHRFITCVVLILVLLVLCTYYIDHYQDYQEHPGTEAVLKSYPIGEEVAVDGAVAKTFSGGFYMYETFNGQRVDYRIITTEKVSVGDKAQVLGVLGPDNTITARDIKITEKWSYLFLFLRSFIALIFLLFVFNRYWKFKWEGKVFVRRR